MPLDTVSEPCIDIPDTAEYKGYDANFAQVPDCPGYIDIQGLNVMQTGVLFLANPVDLFGAVASGPLNLQGRVLVLPND